MKRSLILHLILIGLVICILWIIFASDKKDRPPEKQTPSTETSIAKETEENYTQVATAKEILKIQVFRNIKNPTGLLFLQLK